MKPILFVKTADQLEAARKQYKENLSEFEIVALSSRCWFALQALGIESQMASEFLGPEDLSEIQVNARLLSKSWCEPLGDALTYKGIDLGELLRIDNIQFFREVLAAQRIGERLVQEFHPSEVVLFAEQRVPCLRSHRHLGTHDVCEAVLIDVFQNACVEVQNLARVDKGRFPGIPLRYKKRALAVVRALQGRRVAIDPRTDTNLRSIKELAGRIETRTGERLLLAIGEEIDLLALAPLANIIDSLEGYSALLINSDSEIPSVAGRTGIGNLPNGTVLSLIDGYSRVTDSRVLKRFQKVCRTFGNIRRTQTYPSGSALNNPLLDVHFNALWKLIVESIIPHIDRVSALFSEVTPSGVIVAGVERAKDRATVKIARNRGVRTFAVPHGYIGDVDAYEFETTHFLAWGEASRQCLINNFGKDPDSVRSFGPPHLNKLARKTKVRTASDGRHRLIVLTSRTSPVCFDVTDPRLIQKAWGALIQFMDENENVELIIKPHPGGADNIELYERIRSRFDERRVRIEHSRRLEEMRDEVDVAVAMVDSSTAILVTQLLQIPSLFIRVGWRLMPWAVQAWGLPDGLESVETVSEIGPALNSLLFDHDFQQTCLSRGNRLIAENLKPYGSDGPQSELLRTLDTCYAGTDPVLATAS